MNPVSIDAVLSADSASTDAVLPIDPDPSTKSPEFEPSGFVDVWRGSYHGNPVCIKAIRTRNESTLGKIKRVHGSLVPSGLNSPRISTDVLSRSSRVQTLFPSKCTSHHSGFGGAASVLYHQPMDVGREYHAVHPEESECRSVNAGICP